MQTCPFHSVLFFGWAGEAFFAISVCFWPKFRTSLTPANMNRRLYSCTDWYVKGEHIGLQADSKMSLGDHTFSLSTAVFAKYMYVRPIASSRPRAAPWHCLSMSDSQAVRSDSPTGPKDRQNHQETHTGLPRCRAPAGGLQKFSAPPPRQNAVVKSHGREGAPSKSGAGRTRQSGGPPRAPTFTAHHVYTV